jgi:hypothetical protein
MDKVIVISAIRIIVLVIIPFLNKDLSLVKDNRVKVYVHILINLMDVIEEKDVIFFITIMSLFII